MIEQVPKADFGLPGGSGTWGCLFPEDLHRPEAVVEKYYPKGFYTPYGQSAPCKLVRIGDSHCLTFAMHGWHPGQRIPTDVCAMQVAWCFHQAEVEKILLVASTGGIQDPDFPRKPLGPWSVGPTTDIISPWARRTDMVFAEGVPYPRMAQPTCPELSDILVEVAKKQPRFVVFRHGVYVGTDTRLETPAEIRFFELIGGTVVGQTLQHEFYLWRKIQAHVGHLWIVSNFAESGGTWIENEEYHPEDWDDFYRECAIPCGNVLVDAVLAADRVDPIKCRCEEFARTGEKLQFPVDLPVNWPK